MNKTMLCLAIAGLMFSSKSIADEKKSVKSTLDNATVFFQGAELTHKASAILSKGDNEIWIENLSPKVDQNSLKIKATNGGIITSYEYSIDYLSKKEVMPSQKRMQDSIKIYQKQLRDLEVKLETNEKMMALLDANKNIAGTQNGLSVAELMKMMDYYQSKSNEIQNTKLANEEIKTRITERIKDLELQLSQEAIKNNKTSGVIKLNISSPVATTSALTISYYTASSGWTPYYDINISGTDKPIKIMSKAKVKQTTGLDWNKVKLTLSTSAPGNGKIAPLFNAWFLNFQDYAVITEDQPVQYEMAAQNAYSYGDRSDKKLMIRGASSLAKVSGPLIVVDGIVMPEGTDMSYIDESMIKDMQVLKDAGATSIYGTRAANGVILITLKNSMDDYVLRDENQLNMTYNIDLPYTIEGNGKEQNINLQSYDVKADFSYYCAPKLEAETFLIAEISDWEKLGLLTGKANVTYDGTYIGETTIDAASTLAKLSLTLGADKRVAVKREKLQDFSSRKFLGNDIKQEFAYKLTVKNNQNQSVKVILKDQYPISTQKEIEVELLKETTTPTFKNEEVGVLSWEFELAPGQTKEFKTAYTVKYPKNRPVNLY